MAWYSLTLGDAFERLQSDVTQGLTQAEAARRLAKHGPNTLAQALQRSTLDILLAQFRSIIVALLAAATVIAFAMGDSIEAMAILVVIVINAAIGFFTEWKAAQALSALQKQSVQVAHVIRDGVESEIPAAELVPGDLIILAAGARVPADGRIVESARLQIEEAALRRASTIAFMTLALAQVFHAFGARSQHRSMFTSRLFTNVWLWGAVAVCLLLQAAAVYLPLLQRVLRTVPPTISEWALIAGCSLLPVVVVELVKVIQRFAIMNIKPGTEPL